MITHIKIRGARVHNLKNIDVDIPLNKIVGIAGVPDQENPPWRWASCMQKAPAGIWTPCRPIPAGV